MKAGKPVYIEKPMAVTYEECCRINRISQETGVPCFVAYYRRYLPYFQKVKSLVEEGAIGNVINIQIRFAQPPRNLDYNRENLPWRVQPDIAGGGYFYDLAPHQIDLLQEIFGCILEASGYKSNRGGLYQAEDTISACFQFDNGLVGRLCPRGPYRNHRRQRYDLLFCLHLRSNSLAYRKGPRGNSYRQSTLRSATAHPSGRRPLVGKIGLHLRRRECYADKLGDGQDTWKNLIKIENGDVY